MKIDQKHLQVLIEVDEGEYHAHQSERSQCGHFDWYRALSDAFDDLVKAKLIEWVGNEATLTQWGKDVIEAAVRGADNNFQRG